MTLLLVIGDAGAAIAAFDTVVIRRPVVRFSVCEANSGVHENRARLTPANCRGDTGCPAVAGMPLGECEVIEEVPCAEA